MTPRKGLELLLTGDTVDPQRHRLVTPFSRAQNLIPRRWLARLYKQSASSLRFAKRAFRLAQSADFDQRLADVERLYLEDLMKTQDANEGLNAFIEKRKPVWSGH